MHDLQKIIKKGLRTGHASNKLQNTKNSQVDKMVQTNQIMTTCLS